MRGPIRELLATAALLMTGCQTTATDSPDWQDRCELEIVELHQFFTAWFRGELPNSEAEFSRFETALHPDFHIIPPSGTVLDRPTILELVRAGHGRWSDSSERIEVRNIERRSSVAGAAVFTYEEWQGDGSRMEGRTSTVLMRPHPTDPRRVQWVHVHETAMTDE